MGNAHNLTFRRVDDGAPASLRLLEKAYNELYIPSFPDADERDSLDLWLSCLARDRRLVAIVAGENLDDPEHAALKAFSVAYYFAQSNTGWLCYNIIAPECRRAGLGRRMVDERLAALKDLAAAHGHARIDGVFLEVNDPARVEAGHSGMDPAARLKTYLGMGARIIPIAYVQPETRPGGGRCRNLLLLSWPVEGRHPGPDVVRRYLEELYTEDSAGIAAHDPDFKAMDWQLGQWLEKDALAG